MLGGRTENDPMVTDMAGRLEGNKTQARMVQGEEEIVNHHGAHMKADGSGITITIKPADRRRDRGHGRSTADA